jgi:hypothetical protein
MVRRYEESIEVRAGEGAVGLRARASQSARDRQQTRETSEAPRKGSGDIDSIPQSSPAPSAFLWRGRLYVVRDVIGHWRERRAWWRDALDPDEQVAEHGLDCLEQEVWRVEASPGRLAGTGVYDLGMNDPGRHGLGLDGPGKNGPGKNGLGKNGLGMDRAACTWRLLRVAD